MRETQAVISNFGFDPKESSYHFAIEVGEDETVIEERFTYGDDEAQLEPQVRAIIDPYRWKRIVEAAQSHFNRRLQDAKRKTAKFGEGEHILAPHLGKELTLLAWATEGIDATDMPNAIANWHGMAPEERWWLYLMVKASSNEPEPIENARGWRRAIRIAFCESPAPPPADARHANESARNRRHDPEGEEQVAKRKRLVSTRSLFDEEDPS